MKLLVKFFLIIFLFKNPVFAESYFKINKFSNLSGKSEYEKMEIIFEDYRLYTSRPGAMKIKRISTNELLVLFSDKFKIKFFNDGEDLFDFILDEEKGKIFLRYDDRNVLHWEGRYIEKHNANFYQVLAQGYIPFHFYIKLPGKNSMGLNMKSFSKRIDKAIAKAKVRIAAKYNISLETIEAIMKKRDAKINKELSEIVDEKREELLELASNRAIEDSISTEVERQIELSVGEAMAKEFDAIIIDGMEDVLAQAVNEAVAEAVSEGISSAVAEAAIRAILEVFARGGTEAEAMSACRAIAGDAC